MYQNRVAGSPAKLMTRVGSGPAPGPQMGIGESLSDPNNASESRQIPTGQDSPRSPVGNPDKVWPRSVNGSTIDS